uniref:Uncharacterized protein n=1 Tax=Ficedula albicollis TaxID=59894 RepID=A0A803VE51_FICAL
SGGIASVLGCNGGGLHFPFQERLLPSLTNTYLSNHDSTIMQVELKMPLYFPLSYSYNYPFK